MQKMNNGMENPVLNPDNYIQTRTPDKLELANLIKRAKGHDRTMAEFAAVCGISPSTFSRIANGKIIQPLSLDVLGAICINADPSAKVYLQEFIHANGMVSKEFRDRKEKRRSGSFAPDEERFSLENQMKNVISRALLDRGVGMVSQKRIHINENVPAIVSGCGRGNLLLQLQGFEPKYWKFHTMAPIGVKRYGWDSEKDGDIDCEAEADIMFHDKAEIFLLDAWQSERMEKIKNSFVFHDPDIFEAFFHHVEKATVNNDFSLILVDVLSQSVIEERMLERYDGKESNSPFSLPELEEDEVDGWREDIVTF